MHAAELLPALCKFYFEAYWKYLFSLRWFVVITCIM